MKNASAYDGRAVRFDSELDQSAPTFAHSATEMPSTSDHIEALLRRIYYAVPPKARRTLRRLAFLPQDLFHRSKGHKPVPPRGKIFTGSGDFIRSGMEQMELLHIHTHLKASDRVLDVGSGIGRTAVALMDVLEPPGRYDGIDVVKDGVDWCTGNITSTHPHFRFTHVDLVNDLYNLKGPSAAEFKFPYTNGTFDLVFLFSVFTHMTKQDVGNYLGEIARVMAPQGRCLATFFLYTPDMEQSMDAMDQTFQFPVKGDGFRLMNAQVQGANIAFDLHALDQMAAQHGLVRTGLFDGYWKDQANKRPGHEFQDVVVFRKRQDT